MTKDKLASLIKYQVSLQDRLLAPTPAKHEGNPETYKAFLKNEIRVVTLQIEEAKSK